MSGPLLLRCTAETCYTRVGSAPTSAASAVIDSATRTAAVAAVHNSLRIIVPHTLKSLFARGAKLCSLLRSADTPHKLLDESQIAVNTDSGEHYLVPVRDREIAENFLHSIWHSVIPVIDCHGTAK